jgi:GAF domain-containing protein
VSRSIITLFQQLSERLDATVAMLGAVRASVTHYRSSRHVTENDSAIVINSLAEVTQDFAQIGAGLDDALRQLRQRIDQLNLLYDITSQLHEQASLDQVIELMMDAMWQKSPLSFAVVILGDTELGPYHYQNMRGVSDSWRFLGRECPFPLWGLLARALIPHLNPDKPDYLIVDDMHTEHRPLQEEFPWMKLEGSLMILPLRIHKAVTGALLLGRNEVHGFENADLCEDYAEISQSAARALQLAQMYQELDKRVSQLVGLQLFTRSMTGVHGFDPIIDGLTQGVVDMVGKAMVHIILDERSIYAEKQARQAALGGENTMAAVGQPLLDIPTLKVYMSSTVEHQKLTDLPAPVNRLVGWTMQAVQPVFYDPNEVESAEQFYYNETGRALLVPIVNNDRTIGVMHVVAPDRAQPFDEGDMVVLRTIANTAAMMLSSALPSLHLDVSPDGASSRHAQ